MEVRLEPDNSFNIVPRNNVRSVPRPSSFKPGDRVEWDGSSDTSLRYLPATVKDWEPALGKGMF